MCKITKTLRILILIKNKFYYYSFILKSFHIPTTFRLANTKFYKIEYAESENESGLTIKGYFFELKHFL
jgi:hypothetical protein